MTQPSRMADSSLHRVVYHVLDYSQPLSFECQFSLGDFTERLWDLLGKAFVCFWTQAQAQAQAQIPPPPPPYLGLVKEDVTQSSLAKEIWSFFNNIYEITGTSQASKLSNAQLILMLYARIWKIKAELCTTEFSDLNELTSSYKLTLTSLLVKHAPMKENVVACRRRLPWFNSAIKCAIRTMRKAEKKWRMTKSQQDFRAFKDARNRVTFVMNGARREYYTHLIAENSSNNGTCFVPPSRGCVNRLSSLEMPKASEKECADSDTCASVTFANFKTLSQEQASELIKKAANKSYPLDPIPTSVVLEVLDVVLPVITNMINLSFESGEFASGWKEALLKPLLKNSGLDIAFNNFRPVSNLPYVSKLSEKAAANQLIDHMTANELHMPLQSAYKQNHSTESTLLKVKNDILLNMEGQKVTLLVLLDLSAAFDTV
ncbi:RNA-directed DNA polymerase from mobile element jockey [Stylophora pistillata]|uniref:RNA-directed DNA polymerase from mobile element jockey n=1 Tax=Stylophora pistillata TaxID=50429 RepID=A0A2B4R3W6_STYPI|nr:RNA-directed DNA polymerase from mobile element jockey [Stylophora pistillata]